MQKFWGVNLEIYGFFASLNVTRANFDITHLAILNLLLVTEVGSKNKASVNLASEHLGRAKLVQSECEFGKCVHI